ncbi:hypothetical protein C8Q73DRAFT_709610 [Cubamyces lactineus]|nr:hypothetical protein C8Q73DRAFT_709610 [Cubamyces lactineus]
MKIDLPPLTAIRGYPVCRHRLSTDMGFASITTCIKTVPAAAIMGHPFEAACRMVGAP